MNIELNEPALKPTGKISTAYGWYLNLEEFEGGKWMEGFCKNAEVAERVVEVAVKIDGQVHEMTFLEFKRRITEQP